MLVLGDPSESSDWSARAIDEHSGPRAGARDHSVDVINEIALDRRDLQTAHEWARTREKRSGPAVLRTFVPETERAERTFSHFRE